MESEIMQKDLLTVEEVSKQDLYRIFNLAAKMKDERASYRKKPLRVRSVGMIFAKSSTNGSENPVCPISPTFAFALIPR
jgi:ornithine carbamoyltransferase